MRFSARPWDRQPEMVARIFPWAIAFSLEKSEIQIMIIKMVLLALMIISAATGAASPDYPSGIVTHVVDGDTFEVQGFGLVTLTLAKSPEMGTIEGVHAREFAMERLLNVVIFLDKDDLAGINADGAIPCLVYLSGSDGKPNLNKSFNKMIVEAGFAVIKNDTQSEFNPALW
jgi:endonuclease YncB( thermonuclease family)